MKRSPSPTKLFWYLPVNNDKFFEENIKKDGNFSSYMFYFFYYIHVFHYYFFFCFIHLNRQEIKIKMKLPELEYFESSLPYVCISQSWIVVIFTLIAICIKHAARAHGMIRNVVMMNVVQEKSFGSLFIITSWRYAYENVLVYQGEESIKIWLNAKKSSELKQQEGKLNIHIL